MATRAASATAARRAKSDLVGLLFGRKRTTDHFTYAQLRAAYLDRIQTLHPDKRKHFQPKETSGRRRPSEDWEEETKDASSFVELKEAWNRYEEIAKKMKRVGKDEAGEVDANFTMFGVGCSFSDNELERELRGKIMDQAGRGWFSAGELGLGRHERENSDISTGDHEGSGKQQPSFIPLSNDDLFVESDPRGGSSSDGRCRERRPTLVTVHPKRFPVRK
jgi:hypothetical protein